jgi:acetolactate synthase-1/2/3 large subunit
MASSVKGLKGAMTTKIATGSAVLKGSEITVEALIREGVEVIFGYPGGASMEIHQALTRVDPAHKLRVILPRHEQGAAFAAEGYAKATGKVGVALATSGPGATNLITGLADAKMDSVPIVAITGQVPQALIGKDAFQETDVVGRPVLIDIPKDVQQATAIPEWPTDIHMGSYRPHIEARQRELEQIAEAIRSARKPIIYAGNGAICANASEELLKFVEKTGIPIVTTVLGLGVFPANHPLCFDMLGMHGAVYANYAVNRADLLLAFGVRFDDRVTGKVAEFAKHGTIVHVDIDASEINKIKPAHIPVTSDVGYVLQQLNEMDLGSRDYTPWVKELEQVKSEKPFRYQDNGKQIMPQYVLELLSEKTGGKAIITTGVGQHQMWAAQYFKFLYPRTMLTSAGLGAMGFGFPAALGAKLGCPDWEVIDIDGDGSFVMNIQELATACAENIPVKALILNNQHLGMVVQWEDRFYASNRGHTFIGNPLDPEGIYPDFVTIAKGFDIPACRITTRDEVSDALDEMLAAKTPYVLDVIIPYSEHVLPMIPTGHTFADTIYDE